MAYSEYTGRSLGRILHFLAEYCGVSIARDVTFDLGVPVITHRGTSFAEVTWGEDDQWDVPTFKFLGPNARYYQQLQDERKEDLLKLDAIRAEMKGN